MKLSALVRGEWHVACFKQHKPSTQRRVKSMLRTQILPIFGRRRINEINPSHIEEWFNNYSKSAPGGANRCLDVLKQIFTFAIDLGYSDRNPADAIVRNRSQEKTRFLSKEEINQLHQALDAHVPRGMSGRQQIDIIRLLLLTGCRKAEIVTLRWVEVQVDRLELEDSKTGPRTIYLSDAAKQIIDRQPRRSAVPHVFPAGPRSKRHRSLEISAWRSVRHVAGLDDVRLHDLRHTFASHAAMGGVPLPVLSKLLGHSSLRMTMRYAHLADREVEMAATRIGDAIAKELNTNAV